MNQQRSRRFRSSQEAKEKEDARKEAIIMWEGARSCFSQRIILIFHILAMGKEVSQEEKEKKSWDSNAITPGTPFMYLLASSLRYWVAQKLNTDPGWKNVSSHSQCLVFRSHWFAAASHNFGCKRSRRRRA